MTKTTLNNKVTIQITCNEDFANQIKGYFDFVSGITSYICDISSYTFITSDMFIRSYMFNITSYKFKVIKELYTYQDSFYYNMLIRNHTSALCNLNSFPCFPCFPCVNISDFIFVPSTQSYQEMLIMSIIKILHSHTFKLVLGVVIFVVYRYISERLLMLPEILLVGYEYFLKILPHIVHSFLIFIKLILSYLYNMSLLGKVFLNTILILLFASFANASHTNGISMDSILLILATLGNAFYFLAGVLFDYLSYIKATNNGIIYINDFLSNCIVGLTYFFYIISGVFSSNGLWYYTSSRLDNLLPVGIISGISSVVFPIVWYILSEGANIERFAIINSIFRSIADCVTFNSIAWHTYYLWDLWTINVHNPNVLAIVIFTPVHIIFSLFTVCVEVLGNGSSLLYGVVYYINFSSICIAINGLYAVITPLIHTNLRIALITALASAATAILYPDVYRNITTGNSVNRGGNNLNRRSNINLRSVRGALHNNINYIIFAVIRYFLLIVSFIFASGLLYSYIG